MICLIISNMQHQDSLHISGNSKICNEMWVLIWCRNVEHLVTEPSLSPYSISRIAVFSFHNLWKLNKVILMILSRVSHLNIFCKVDWSHCNISASLCIQNERTRSWMKDVRINLEWKSACCQCLASQYTVLGPEPEFSSFINAWWTGPWGTLKLEVTISAT